MDIILPNSASVYSVQNTTSSLKTPSGNAQYQALTGNSITLQPGTYRLSGFADFNNGGSSPVYTACGVGFYGANGADSGTTPTLLSATTGVTVLSSNPSNNGVVPIIATGSQVQANPFVIRVSQAVTVYLVSLAQGSTIANSRITVYATAERLL